MQSELPIDLMSRFADQTGLTEAGPPRRYLWTDAFAVCNLLGLAQHTGDAGYRDLALRLVDQVHDTLGRHRDDDPRAGWISGLSEEEGRLHPTRGGLRIGKPLNERNPDEPLDQTREWDRDGQYFHYLTRWMHALHRVARHTGLLQYHRWACELAVAAHDAFTFQTGGARRMVWKMSVDLNRPLVSAMGQHDPLDGLVTYLDLHTAEAKDPDAPDLTRLVAEAAEMCEDARWATEDPLGIGGLLGDAARLGQIVSDRAAAQQDVLDDVLRDTRLSLEHFVGTFSLAAPADARLAFRELGLSIGLKGVELTQSSVDRDPALTTFWVSFLKHRDVGEAIAAFWSEPEHRKGRTWTAHEDINSVMLATALAPDGYVRL